MKILKKKNLEIKNSITKMKNAFNDRPDMAEKENSELENMTRETPINEKQREKIEGEKNPEYPRTMGEL